MGIKSILQKIAKRFSKAPESADIQLISIHIPKTAGTSFRNSLKAVYGDKEVVRLDIDLVKQEVKINEQRYDQSEFPQSTKVIHGHYSYPLLIENFKINQDIPIITWLRDPVQRVISNYLYLSEILENLLQEEQKGLNILQKMKRSLKEYALFEGAQNRQSKFLTGLNIEDLKFVGIVEHYDEDINRLAKILKWDKAPIFKNNKTKKETNFISNNEIEVIRQLNTEDLKLYEKAISLREKNHWL